MKESRNLEFKEMIQSNTFLKTVSAFANYGTGRIVFGIDDDGQVKGIKNTIDDCLSIENKMNDNMNPVPLYDLNINKENPLGSGGVIASSFKQFLQEMSSSSIYARNPINFRRELIRKYNTFNNYSQHDSQEVVWAILDALHEDLNQSPFAKGDKTPPRYSMDEFKWKNQSFIMDLFQGYFQFSISAFLASILRCNSFNSSFSCSSFF